ncbi:class A beta-lactamase-related serine hydrolase [Oceanobacillus jeddahense]|uniref:Class A beta-lactamase-related serine hydrolase n=1 Tax=Oceanobacillus jeddahense TaxID=1462527 RepID=A0ABY5JLR7_9BACI|nr:class A beta-lactamase-related serine hydrolase [Oceanobacillus jeddahense]UUI01250.1 class A beta-lactamase-related serine hydrolase [Oceanobacillus jeddahense]
MKKFYTLLFVCLLVLLGACSKDNEDEQETSQNDMEQDEALEENNDKEDLDPATGLFMEFIKENKDSDRVAFLATWNNEPIAEINTDLALPLASVVKIIIAIEFASQAEEGNIDPSEMIAMEEVDKYYFPNTDGGAHDAWKSTLEDEEGDVSLEQIAQGMMDFSSNANTDYLIERLGLEEVNNRIEELDLNHHEPIYPLTASIAIPKKVMEDNNIEENELEDALRDLDDDAYRQIAVDLFEEWQEEPWTDEEKEEAGALLDMSIQKVWSDRLTHATAEDYHQIMAMLNNKEHYSEAFYEELDAIFSLDLEDESIVRTAQKGGSTAFVLNQAVYAEDADGNRFEMILFTNDLNLSELEVAAMQVQALTDKLVNEEDFREEVKETLAE